MKLSSYSKIYNINDKSISGPQGVLNGYVEVTEKVDGSQISWGKVDGQLFIRSKEQELNLEQPEKLFSKAVETIKALESKLVDGWVYRGEAFSKPKHNALLYDRVPRGNVILYDIDAGDQKYLGHQGLSDAGLLLNLEVVPLLWSGLGEELQQDTMAWLLDKTSILGGQKIEGVVIKNYTKLNRDGKVMMAKLVSPAFKEVHRGKPKDPNATSKDIILSLIAQYKNLARWNKAILHLREKGVLVGEMRDIGPIVKEISKDIEEECSDEIKDALWDWAKGPVLKGSVAGFAEFYKERLLEQVEEMDKCKVCGQEKVIERGLVPRSFCPSCGV